MITEEIKTKDYLQYPTVPGWYNFTCEETGDEPKCVPVYTHTDSELVTSVEAFPRIPVDILHEGCTNPTWEKVADDEVVPNIPRGLLEQKIEQSIVGGKRVIITGLDGSGKSTLVSKYFTDYYTLKVDIKFSEHMKNCSKELCDIMTAYKVFDRFPLTDYPVYDFTYSEGWGMYEYVLDNLNQLELFDEVYIILDDEFVSQTVQPEHVLTNRNLLISRFKFMAGILSNIYGKEVYLVPPKT